MSLVLDYSYMLSPPVEYGIAPGDLEAVPGSFAAAFQAMKQRESAGELGFLAVTSDSAALGACEAVAAQYAGRLDDVVVLGIGGSALGTTALRTALLPPLWNLGDASRRGGRPRLHVLDNVDPETMRALLLLLAPGRSLFLVISKSGGTAETMAQYLIARAWLEESLSTRAREHLVFITDPARGSLRAIAQADAIAALDVPPNIGGRFSVLSAVGMLPALLTGMDARAILGGAEDMRVRCANPEMMRNPAGVYAVLQWLAHEKRGAGIHVFMPYSDALRDLSLWFVQLWAESLGKVASGGRHVGPTPLAALGATDQHSQVQLFMEGPRDKTVTFVAVGSHGDDIGIPATHGAGADLDYLGGHSLGELLDAERKATAGALAARGRPSMTITLDVVDARHIGELLMMLEVATVFAGALYEVNPLDQPGVELGKQFTFALMGKTNSERAMAEWKSVPPGDRSRTV